jgi:hypothetical protein
MEQLFDGSVSATESNPRQERYLRKLGTRGTFGASEGAGSDSKFANQRGLFSSDPADLLHWAAVSLIIAATSAVLSYAAGTQDLAVGAHIASAVFSIVSVGLLAGGLLRWRERHGTAAAGELPAEFRSSHLGG